VNYREKGHTDLYEEHLRDIVLRRHSAFGPWLVMGLGVVLTCFLSYLVYNNLVLYSAGTPSPERSLRMMTESAPATTVLVPSHISPPPLRARAITVTSVPQSRATHALLGGEGPALLPGRMAVTVPDAAERHPIATAIPR
jgi:hypothetical protein